MSAVRRSREVLALEVGVGVLGVLLLIGLGIAAVDTFGGSGPVVAGPAVVPVVPAAGEESPAPSPVLDGCVLVRELGTGSGPADYADVAGVMTRDASPVVAAAGAALHSAAEGWAAGRLGGLAAYGALLDAREACLVAGR